MRGAFMTVFGWNALPLCTSSATSLLIGNAKPCSGWNPFHGRRFQIGESGESGALRSLKDKGRGARLAAQRRCCATFRPEDGKREERSRRSAGALAECGSTYQSLVERLLKIRRVPSLVRFIGLRILRLSYQPRLCRYNSDNAVVGIV